MQVSVAIGSDLRVRRSDLPPGSADEIRRYLTIANGAKAKALHLKQWGAADMPDSIELWRDEGPHLVMPRGFAAVLRSGLEARGSEVCWDDQTSSPSLGLSEMASIRRPDLRPDQERAVVELLGKRQGILQSPTAGGKTVVGLECWRRSGLVGLVLVERSTLLEQWRDRAREHLGVEAGIIGDGAWKERSLTIAMIQTLRRRLGELDRDQWWRRWGLTLFDEAHHAIAETYRLVVERVCSRYLIGKTATALEGQWERQILIALLGPVVHVVSSRELADQGVRLTPRVQVVKTGFRWAPNGQEAKLVDQRAIYRHVISALEQDPDRLDLIARTIAQQPSSCAQLVVCKRLEYLDSIATRIEAAGYPTDRILFMRGSESREEKRAVAFAADEGGCVILSTVAGEGVDIPRLDRLHMTWPKRKRLTIIQEVGRVLRHHPQKREVVVIDYADPLQPMLRAQMYARISVYRESGYRVEVVE